jgi:hypothetical protein
MRARMDVAAVQTRHGNLRSGAVCCISTLACVLSSLNGFLDLLVDVSNILQVRLRQAKENKAVSQHD